MFAKFSSFIVALLLLVASVQAAPATEPTTQASKPWVEDWAAYVSSAKSRGWRMIRAESGDACVTIEEAKEQAIERATNQVEQIIRPQIQQRFALPANISSEVHRQIAAALSRGEMVSDQYLKKIDKPYGTLWKQYILIDVGGADVAPLVAKASREVKTNFAAHMAGWISLAALSGVIVLVYAFLNSATKGYFVWRLRTAAILIVIAAVLTVCAVL
ncbi:MAG TPA: hypothetical protein VHD56_07530 [Tepidisphaeraceae bacterium]|nr:hypothetical protein [Tepidisphaeraceae bacterium]